MPRVLRIAAISGFYPDPQGEAHYATEVFTRLARRYEREVEVTVFAHVAPGRPTSERVAPNIVVHRRTGGRRLHATLAAIRLGKEVLDAHPDVVHFQGVHTPLYGGLYGEAILPLMHRLRREHVKVVTTMHSTWMRSDVEDLWRKKGLPVVGKNIATAWYGHYLRTVASLSDVFRIATGNSNLKTVRQFVTDYRLRPRWLVEEAHPCSVAFVSSDAVAAAKAKLGLGSKRIILTIGYVRPDKNLHTMIAAARALESTYPDALVLVAGMPVGRSGQEYASELAQMARTSPNVLLRFEFLSPDELSRYFDAADLVVVPYGRVLGPSGPVHHALSRGKPVLATRLEHNIGLDGAVALFDPDNPRELASLLLYLLSDASALSELAARGKAYAERHTWEKLADEYFREYLFLRDENC